MEPTQGEKSKPIIASSNDASLPAEKDHPPSAPASTQPAAPPPDKKDQPEAETEDTLTIKPGDPLYEAVQAAKAAAELAAAPAEEPDRTRKKAKADSTVIVPGAGRMPPAPLGRHTGPLEEHKTAYRRWLGDKSKDELIDLLINLEMHEPAPSEHTEKIPTRPVITEETPDASPGGYQVPEDLPFIRLPIVRKTAVYEPTPTWRIVLVALDQSARPLGLQIDSEITIGRIAGDAVPDLDLTPFGAKSKGVSRIHARLRPEMNTLVLIDAGSSNGTFWNKVRLPPDTSQAVKDGDIITFGRVNFLVKVVKAPSMHETRTLL